MTHIRHSGPVALGFGMESRQTDKGGGTVQGTGLEERSGEGNLAFLSPICAVQVLFSDRPVKHNLQFTGRETEPWGRNQPATGKL